MSPFHAPTGHNSHSPLLIAFRKLPAGQTVKEIITTNDALVAG